MMPILRDDDHSLDIVFVYPHVLSFSMMDKLLMVCGLWFARSSEGTFLPRLLFHAPQPVSKIC